MAMQTIKNTTQLAARTLASTTSQAIDLNGLGDSVALQVNYANATTAAKTFISGTYEVQTLTFPTKASAANGDYVVVYDQAANSYAVALTKPVAAVSTITTQNKAGTTGGDYVVFYDGSGLSWAAALNVSGSDPAPSGAIYTAIPAGRKSNVDVSGATTATNIADLVRTAMNALTGFTAAITLSGTATIVVTRVVKAPVTASGVHNENDTGAGSIAVVDGTAGVAAQTPTGAAWVAATQKGLADISGDTTAAQVAARAETAINLLTGFTTNVTSDDTAANGTMLLTQALTPGPVTDPIPHTYNDGGAGSIAGVQTTLGVLSKVNLSTESVSITAHGQYTGSKGQLTSTGTLPTGLSLSTDYFVIVVDANTIQFASSLANAVLGTAVDITGYGIGTQTFTPTTSSGGVIKAQASCDGVYFTDINPTNFPNCSPATVTVSTTTGGACWDLGKPSFRYVNILFTPSAGTITFSVLINSKSDR